MHPPISGGMDEHAESRAKLWGLIGSELFRKFKLIHLSRALVVFVKVLKFIVGSGIAVWTRVEFVVVGIAVTVAAEA